jgi:hypothetical protein
MSGPRHNAKTKKLFLRRLLSLDRAHTRPQPIELLAHWPQNCLADDDARGRGAHKATLYHGSLPFEQIT